MDNLRNSLTFGFLIQEAFLSIFVMDLFTASPGDAVTKRLKEAGSWASRTYRVKTPG